MHSSEDMLQLQPILEKECGKPQLGTAPTYLRFRVYHRLYTLLKTINMKEALITDESCEIDTSIFLNPQDNVFLSKKKDSISFISATYPQLKNLPEF